MIICFKVDLQLPTAISDLSEFLTKLQVNIDAVKNWREKLTVLAKGNCIIISPLARSGRYVWEYIGFGHVAPPCPQMACERNYGKTNPQNLMKLCRSLDISM